MVIFPVHLIPLTRAPSKVSPDDIAFQDFRWSNVVPSKTLAHTPCFGSYQCARLSVPLTWNVSQYERDNGPQVAIVVVKLPAKVPVTDARYGGPVVLNPGGPGESGVHQVLADGKHIQTTLDSPEGKTFGILSFDSRGVNNTTPSLSCFPMLSISRLGC